MVTIHDVAKQAGVSAATVSRVFNGIKVNPAMTESVKAAAADLGFVPNRNARRLRTSSSEIIAMLIPDIENPFFTAMTRAVEDKARAAGYSVMLCNTDEDPDKEQEYLRVAVSDPVAGIVMAPSRKTADLSLALERNVPIVCVDRRAPGLLVDSAVADNVSGARAATHMLFNEGYHRVGCVTGRLDINTAEERHRGWQQAFMERTSSAAPEELAVEADFSIAGGEEAARRLLSLPQPPDAIFAASNKLAAGVIRALAEQGLMPPEVGVVAFGGLPMVLLKPEGIMVTHLPAREIGLTAADMLLERIGGLDVPPREVVLPVVIADEESGLSAIDRDS